MPETYAAIRSSMLVPDRALGVEVYVLISGRPVRWALQGDVLERVRIDKLMAHRIRKVLIRAVDEPVFRTYIEQAFDDTLTKESASTAEKVTATAAASDMAAQDILKKPEDKDAFVRSQIYFERFGSIVASLPGGLSEMISKPYDAETHDHLAHALRVAAISVAVASKLGLVTKDQDRTALVTACYLHDAALESKGVSRQQTRDPQVRQKIAGYDQHPLDGARMFQGKEFVNSRVLDIIAQHEETPNGDGFPQKLNKAKMDPLAIIVSLVNRFEDYYERHNGKSSAAIADFFKSELGRYELEHLKLLESVVKGA